MRRLRVLGITLFTRSSRSVELTSEGALDRPSSCGPQPFTWPAALVWRGRRRQPPAAKAFLALAIARAEQAPPVRVAA